jgi:cell division protein FtsQ
MNAESIAIGEYELRIPWIVPRLLAGLAALLAVAVMIVQMAPYANRPVARIRVDGHFTHLRATRIAAIADVEPGTRLFDLDLMALRARVEALPWVASARVSREWPDAVAIAVVERRPVAHWGQRSLLDSEGHIFTPPVADLDDADTVALPRLAGPDARVDDVRLAYAQLSAALTDGPFALAGLTLDARGAWSAQARSGIALRLGHDDPVALAPVLNGNVTHSLTPRMESVAYVDLRYPNGFAVGWRDGSATALDATRATGAHQ